MDLTVVRYIVVIIVVLILIWAVLEMRWRFKRYSKQKVESLQAWTPFDTTTRNAMLQEPQPVLSEDGEEQEEKSGQDLHLRAQQNGHYSESKKPH